jgi:hypothetical protein
MFIEHAFGALREPPDPIVQAAQPPVARAESEDWIVSLSLGGHGEPSALALLRREVVRRGDVTRPYYGCNFLRRWPAGTACDAIRADVGLLFDDPRLAGKTLVLERTAVGVPVVRLFAKLKARVAVLLTNEYGMQEDGLGGWRVGKIELVSTMQILLSRQRFGNEGPLFRVAKGLGEVAGLLDVEWGTFQAMAQPMSEPVGRETANEDLALAVASGCWYGEFCRRRLAVG